MPITRRTALLTVALAVLPGAPALAAGSLSPDDQALEAKAVAYLESLSNAKGRFRQIDPRGNVTDGVLYLSRPGRARFEYAPPSGLLITSDGKTVTLSDSRLKTFHRYPLGATPLGLFLAKQIRLDKGAKVTAVTRTADGFSVTARDIKGEAHGEITLDFADNPMRLAGWSILDAQRKVTRVELQDLAPVAAPPDSLFVQTKPGTPSGG
jgi:outer membrane lipoprotein-sorting protein